MGVPIWERYGQSEELRRKLGRSSADIPAIPDVPDVQWCFPLRRQQADVAVSVNSPGNWSHEAPGHYREHETSDEPPDIIRAASTSPAYVTNELLLPPVPLKQLCQFSLLARFGIMIDQRA